LGRKNVGKSLAPTKTAGKSECPKGWMADLLVKACKMRVKCSTPSKIEVKSQCPKGWMADLVVKCRNIDHLHEQLN
jgi:hypothetical protein